jgi:anaerobic selenocysteine-containing dehydrogenase
LTDTARLAHLVLPTTTLLEADDLLGSYGHHWIGAARPVVTPPSGVKSDLEIMQALADRVGLTEALAGTVRDWKRRLAGPKLEPHGITLETLEAGPVRNPIPKKVLFADRKFFTASGRVNLITKAPPSKKTTSSFPLWLMSLSTEKSQSSHWAVPQEGPATVTVHPDAAGNLREGELCRLESAISSMVVRLRFDCNQRHDLVIVPKGGQYSEGRCANALLRACTTDLGEGGALYDEHVRLVPLSSRTL